MESLDSLKTKLRDAEKELEKITRRKHKTVPWAPGVQDQYETVSYSYDDYTDLSKAYRLMDIITDLKNQIETYAQRAQAEREREQIRLENQIPKYDYIAAGKAETTTNPAIAARYNAQHRLFGMNKLKQTMMTLSGQKRKFGKLWNKAVTPNKKSQEQIASELNKMFR